MASMEFRGSFNSPPSNKRDEKFGNILVSSSGRVIENDPLECDLELPLLEKSDVEVDKNSSLAM